MWRHARVSIPEKHSSPLGVAGWSATSPLTQAGYMPLPVHEHLSGLCLLKPWSLTARLCCKDMESNYGESEVETARYFPHPCNATCGLFLQVHLGFRPKPGNVSRCWVSHSHGRYLDVKNDQSAHGLQHCDGTALGYPVCMAVRTSVAELTGPRRFDVVCS